MSFEADEGVDGHVLLGDAPGAAEVGQVDDEGRGDDLAAGAADQLDRGVRRATGRDQVVDEEDTGALMDRVGVDLDGVDAVFEAVVLTDRPPGQLALLADRYEAAAELVRDGATEDEAARLDADDVVDAGR